MAATTSAVRVRRRLLGAVTGCVCVRTEFNLRGLYRKRRRMEAPPPKRFVAALCERRILSAVADRRYRASHAFGVDRCYRSRRLHSENPIRFDSVPNRLGRLDRIYVRAPIYFLTACTAQRRPLLAKQDVHLISGFKNGFVGRFCETPI